MVITKPIDLKILKEDLILIYNLLNDKTYILRTKKEDELFKKIHNILYEK